METLSERLIAWAQNEEMVDQHFTTHGKDCNEAGRMVADLLDVAQAFLSYLQDDSRSERRRQACTAAARAAIAKAKGEV